MVKIGDKWAIQERKWYKWVDLVDSNGIVYLFENAETAGIVISHAVKKAKSD